MHNAKVHPQPRPPVKVDSEYNTVHATVQLQGSFAPTGLVRPTKGRQFDRSMLRSDVEVQTRAIDRISSSLPEVHKHPEPGHSCTVREMAGSFTNAILEASRQGCRPHHGAIALGGDVRLRKPQPPFLEAALHAREEARHLVRIAEWMAPEITHAKLREVVHTGMHAHLE